MNKIARMHKRVMDNRKQKFRPGMLFTLDGQMVDPVLASKYNTVCFHYDTIAKFKRPEKGYNAGPVPVTIRNDRVVMLVEWKEWPNFSDTNVPPNPAEPYDGPDVIVLFNEQKFALWSDALRPV